MSLDPALALRLAAALAIGVVVGLERGFHLRQEAPGTRIAGLRTFIVAALLGAVSSLLADTFGAAVLAAALLALAGLALAGYVLRVRQSGDRGATTELALLATFALAALAVHGAALEAVALATVLAAVLGAKTPLHAGLAWLEPVEMRAMLQVLVLAAVALPLLPARDLGPWDAVNPRTIGWLVLLIVGLQLVGWFAVRLLGARRGVLLTALLGGLSSSTAVTVAFARMAARGGAPQRMLAAGVALAAAAMVPRMLIEVAAVQPTLLARLLLPLGALGLVPVAAAAWTAWGPGAGDGAEADGPDVALRNPFELSAALGWAALLTLLALAVGAARVWLGDPGVYAVAALAGLADVDAIAIALARAAGGGLEAGVAAGGIVVAGLVNTLSKAALAGLVGGGRFGLRSAAILGAAAGVAGAVLLAMRV
ncbi:MAG: DUF4010 domain-containing protein [Myxococcota bacterium]|nr:DUF4010 domain-containing protein [Myxococcota bacterium]